MPARRPSVLCRQAAWRAAHRLVARRVTLHPGGAITVMIPTRGAPERRSLLARAVASVLCQRDVDAHVLLVVNGAGDANAIDLSILDDPRVRVLALERGHLAGAYRAGVALIDTPYFGSLDDDDLLTPDALKVRRTALERHPEALAVVTNGFRREGGQDVLHVTDGREIERDPLRALLRRNWLLPGSWLCRTTPATRAAFDGMPAHLENTYLGIRFAELGMIWVNEPTVTYSVGSPLAVSRSREFAEAQAAALRRILELDLPPYARRALRPRVAAALHRAANLALEAGAVGEAWRWHAATLRERSGWRYLPFARHLLRATFHRS